MLSVLRRLKKRFGYSFRQSLRRGVKELYLRARHFGFSRHCPVCDAHLRGFLPFGVTEKRPNALCPVCGSLERDRLVWMFLHEKTNLFGGQPVKLLHFAPEPVFQRLLSLIPYIDYLSADLYDPTAMLQMDITAIPKGDSTFDVIYCSHVLEHIPDDRKAMRELFRVLRPGGWAILQVPIMWDRETTFEDWSVQTPEERERVFGQSDHVRIYGRDYQERLTAAGFRVTVIPVVEAYEESQIRFVGLDREEQLYYCEKVEDGLSDTCSLNAVRSTGAQPTPG
jgi:SAM-dependent methyltransferase